MTIPGNEKNNQDDWLQLIKNNDQAFLTKLYQSNYKKIEQYILANHGDENDAKDIFQESFVAAWRNVQMERFAATELSSFAGYLFTISRNKWMDTLRRKKRQQTSELKMEMEVSIADELQPDELVYINRVKEQFKELGDQCKTILQLFYYENKSMREIADQFQITEASAKNNKYRCLQKLREWVHTNLKSNNH